MIVTDVWFYAVAIPAIVVTGISKGGFGSGLGIVAVPAMTLVAPPLQVLGIMLPILCLMDLFGVWAYRRHWDGANLAIMVPAAVIGIWIGWATFELVEERHIRLLIGVVAVVFALDHWLRPGRTGSAGRSIVKGGLWCTLSGFTSFVGHAGGPPVSVYLLPQRLDKTIFAGTTVLFFTAVNYTKLVPYGMLGQLSDENLLTALVLAPVAAGGMRLGIRLHRTVDPVTFYRVCYVFVFVVGLKLLYDGLAVGAWFG